MRALNQWINLTLSLSKGEAAAARPGFAAVSQQESNLTTARSVF